MKRFHFSLRAVAVMRRHRELGARLALAGANQACAQAEARRFQALARAGETAGAIASGRSGSFRAGDQAVFVAAHRRECAAVAEAEAAAAAARAEVARRREECIEASRQLKVITRLEEKARAAHRAAVLAGEQQQLDEIGVGRKRIGI
jgi:flagellar biosynthesis chaperone FliJ